MNYYYTVENKTRCTGEPVVVETIYPLTIGMHTQVVHNGMKRVVKVKEIIMYADEAVIVVEEA